MELPDAGFDAALCTLGTRVRARAQQALREPGARGDRAVVANSCPSGSMLPTMTLPAGPGPASPSRGALTILESLKIETQ